MNRTFEVFASRISEQKKESKVQKNIQKTKGIQGRLRWLL